MFDSDDIEILHETKDMIIELNACVATWATMCGKPEDSSSLVAYLTKLLKTKQDLFYYIVETEVSKEAISPLVEGVVAFVKETNKLYVYSATAGWIDLTPDLSDFYTKDETDALLALKANIEDFYSKIEADERFATLTDLQAHLDDKNNPHKVTKAQVGLGNVENIAPLDMPISNATQSALNNKQDVITGAVSNVVSDNLPENKLVVTDNNGKLDTTDLIDLSKLELLDGLDGNIQEQLDSKEDKFTKNTAFNRNFTTNLFDIKMDGVASLGVANEIPRADHRHPSDTSKLDKNPLIAPSTATKVTYDEKGLVIGGTVLAITDIPDLSSIYEKSIFKVNILNDSTYQYPTTHAVTVAIADKADKSYVDFNLQTFNERLKEKENAFTKNTAFNKNFSIDKQELQMDGEANVGTSLNIPRADHRHPTDTTREAVANKTDYYSDASPITYPSSRALYNGLRTRLKPTNVIPGDNITVTVDGERIIISSYGSKSATWGHIIGNLSDQTDLINYIDTGIATSSATFRGTFNSVADLEAYSGEKDNNDYAFVISTDSAGNTVYDRYKYDGTQWLYEYSLNNSSFDADQWAAINSKATQAKIAQITTNANDITDLQTNKADKTNATAGTYTKVTINSDGLVSSGTTLSASDIPDISDTYYLASNPAGYTNNVGTVTSVNNVEPVNGNVTIEIPDTATWGNITGTLSNQTDLANALNSKANNTDIDDLNDRIDEIELFKFPNAIIIGEPTIQNGQISDFSTVSYLQFPFVFDFQDRAFQVDFCFTTAQNVQTQQNIIDSNFGIALAIQNGKGVMAISSNGTSWDIGVATGNIDIQSNTTYYARLLWNKLQYKTQLSTDGVNYTDDMVIVNTKRPFPTTVFIGGCSQSETGHDPHPFLGTINLNKAYLYVNNQLIWQGMDDAGLSTRADVSLNNLDAEGEARFNAKQDVIEDIDTIRDLAKGAQKGVSFTNYQSMVTNLNGYEYDKFIIGQSIYIATKDVPDVWVYAKYQESQQYTYTDDNAIIEALKTGTLRIGRFEISQLETGKVDIDGVIKGVKVNNVDLTPDSDKKVNVPIATTTTAGVVVVKNGLQITSAGNLNIQAANDAQVEAKTDYYRPIVPVFLDKAVKVGITTNTLTLTDEEKTNAQNWLGVTPSKTIFRKF